MAEAATLGDSPSPETPAKALAMPHAKLASVTLPDFGDPVFEPALPKSLYESRITRLRARAKSAGFDAVVIFGDREHVANISWATGYDPRFEEAICVVTQSRVVLFAGNEGYPYAECANGTFETRVVATPEPHGPAARQNPRPCRSPERSGTRQGMAIGLAGWKGYETEDGVFDPDWFETPNYLVETLARLRRR